MKTRTRRAAGLIAVTTAAIFALTACMSVTYKLSVNSDATLSGTLQVQLAREVASTFGITSKDQLNESITSGELSEGVDPQVAKDCKVVEDSTNFTINCLVDHVQASDVDESWSLTKEGTDLTFHIVSAGQEESADSIMPGMEIGQFTFSATFPGPISSVTGEGATKTDANTVEVKGSLSKTIDVTVVGSSEGSSSNSNPIVFLVLGLAVILLIVFSLLVLRRPKKHQAPAEDPTV